MLRAVRSVIAVAVPAAALIAFASTGCSSSSSSGGTTAALGGCYPTDSSCGIAGTKCQALVDVSKAAKKTLRMSQLQLTKPALLASKAIQFSIIGPAVSLDAPKCYLTGGAKGGTFNWLIEIDTAAKTMKTGGAPPIADPHTGYCFLNKNFNGLQVGPLSTPIEYNADTGEFSTNATFDVVVPIFLDKAATQTPIILPLKGGRFNGAKLTENGNCIGRFRGDAGELDDTCSTQTTDPLLATSYQFENNATLSGYVTVLDADQVLVVDLGVSLCSLLANVKNPGKDPISGKDFSFCKDSMTGKIDFSKLNSPPDFASPTAGGMNDAYELGAKFSAAAVQITGDCP